MAKRSLGGTRTTTFDIEPVPASRARVTRWGVYYGKKYTKFKKDMEELLADYNEEPLQGLLKMKVVCWVQLPKSYSKKKVAELNGQWCGNNADVDNYAKQYLTV